jgi:hypothetical protein
MRRLTESGSASPGQKNVDVSLESAGRSSALDRGSARAIRSARRVALRRTRRSCSFEKYLYIEN